MKQESTVEKLMMEEHFTMLNAWDNSEAFYPTDRIETIDGKMMMKGSGGSMDYILFGVRKVNEVNLTLGVKVLLDKDYLTGVALIMRTRVELNPKGGGDLQELVKGVFPNFAANASDATRVRHEICVKLPLYPEYLVPMATDIAYSVFLAHLHQFRGMEAIKTPEEIKEYFIECFTKQAEANFQELEESYIPTEAGFNGDNPATDEDDY